jgi:hypothetical protein
MIGKCSNPYSLMMVYSRSSQIFRRSLTNDKDSKTPQVQGDARQPYTIFKLSWNDRLGRRQLRHYKTTATG